MLCIQLLCLIGELFAGRKLDTRGAGNMNEPEVLRAIPSKYDCIYILAMVETRLINYSYTQPWADKIIEEIDSIPGWLFSVSTKSSFHEQSKALRNYVYSEPFEQAPSDIEKFYVGCYWLRYERKELSWATYLNTIGSYLDTAGVDWACETPYYFLNVVEDAYFSDNAEAETKNSYLSEHDVLPWAKLAAEKFAPFMVERKSKLEQ